MGEGKGRRFLGGTAGPATNQQERGVLAVFIMTADTATVKVDLREQVAIGEARQGARLLSGTHGGTFRDMERAGDEAAEVALLHVLAARHGLAVTRGDGYGAMPRSRGDRTPLAPPSALCRDEPREFLRGSDTDDFVPTGRHIDLYA